MATADEVIVEFEARVDKYERDIKRSANTFERATGNQRRQIQQLEKQIEASSRRSGASLKSLASALAAAFSARQAANAIDSWTRYTNQLKVAGLEGQALTAVQEKLFTVAQRNGVQIEAVGTLYSRAAQNQRELGASTQDLIDLTRAVSASLRISGTSTEEASGALLQLGQALGSPRVQAEEFNSLLDTMQPLLREASKYIDGTGDSLSGLTRKIKDTKGPGVSNIELFNAITKAMGALEEQASSAQLTIAGSFQVLENAATKYIGSAASANGVTGALTAGIGELAENLDTVAEALAVIAVVMGARYAVSAATAAAASLSLSTSQVRATLTAEAMAAAQANASRYMLSESAAANAAAASVSRLAVAQGLAARAGSGLLAVVGGPLGAAVLALGTAFTLLAQKEANADAAAQALTDSIDAQSAKFEIARQKRAQVAAETDNLTKTQRDALESVADLTGEADLLADAWGRVAAQAKQAAIEQARAAYMSARTNTRNAQAAVDARQETAASRPSSNAPSGSVQGVVGSLTRSLVDTLFPGETKRIAKQTKQETENLNKAIANEADAWNDWLNVTTQSLKTFKEEGKTGADGAGGAGGSSSGKSSKKETRDAAAASRELASLRMEELRARSELATDAEERAALEFEILQQERKERIAQIEANEDLTAAQKALAKQAIDRLYGAQGADGTIVANNPLYGQAINREAERQNERDMSDLARARYDADREILQNQYDIAETQADRRRIAMQMLDLEEDYQKALLEAVIASKTASKAEKERARIALDALPEISAGRRETSRQDTRGPLSEYIEGLDKSPQEINEEIQGYIVDELESVQDSISAGIASVIGTKDPLLTGLIDLFVQQVIMKPIIDAWASLAKDLGGSVLGSIFGSVTGSRAVGGRVNAGQAVRVGENGQEVFVPGQSGTIVPNSRLSGQSAATNVYQSFTLDARQGITTPELLQHVNTVAKNEGNKARAGAAQDTQKLAPQAVQRQRQYGI